MKNPLDTVKGTVAAGIIITVVLALIIAVAF